MAKHPQKKIKVGGKAKKKRSKKKRSKKAKKKKRSRTKKKGARNVLR